ncbi:MAG: hypothetical protein WAS07_04810 [Micropruina sp.]
MPPAPVDWPESELTPAWDDWWTSLVAAYARPNHTADLERLAGAPYPVGQPALQAAIAPVLTEASAWASDWRDQLRRSGGTPAPRGLLALASGPQASRVQRALREPGGSPVPDDVTLLVVPAEGPWGVRARLDVFLISADVASDKAIAARWLSQLRH